MEFEKNILSDIGELLLSMGETISVAESVTSGFLQFSFSQITDASKFYKGGITAYTLEEKVKFLKIDRNEAEQCDCVSDHIAQEMALNVVKAFNSDWSIAVTGYATPVKESDFKVFAWFSLCHNQAVVCTEKIDFDSNIQHQNAQISYSEIILSNLKTKLELKRSK